MAQCADNYFHHRYRHRRRHHHCRRRHRHRRAVITGADDNRFNILTIFCDACDPVVANVKWTKRGETEKKYICIHPEEGASNVFIFRRRTSTLQFAVFVNHRCY